MDPGRARRALMLLLLLLSSTLVQLPPAAAQDSGAVIVFEGKDETGAVSPPPPDYLQTDEVRIVINGATTRPMVEVRCVARCPDPDVGYFARWRGVTLRFPADFVEADPDTGIARSAVADQVPKYNSTWQVDVHTNPAPQSRRFHVWSMDVFESPDAIAQPGATYRISARGFDTSDITLRIDHVGPDGSTTTVHGPVGRRSVDTRLVYLWEVPVSEARRVLECRKVALDCDRYQLIITGGGKHTDVMPFRLEPSRLLVTPIEATGPVPRTVARTEGLEAHYIFHYPGGTFAVGDPLTPDNLPQSSVNPTRRLRVQIENVTADNAYLVDETYMEYDGHVRSWRVHWTVPKDLDLGPTGRPLYRIVLPETQDMWGNRVPSTVLGNFTLERATLVPTLVTHLEQLPRTEEGRVSLRVAYLNGSLWTDEDNRTQLRGCFIRADAANVCPDGSRVAGTYEGNGTWVFRVRYARDHADLDAYKFFFPEGADDRWGNRLTSVESPPYEVVVGSQRIQFKTIMRGLDTTTLERGNRVSLQAVVTYADGAPYNHTVAPHGERYLNMTLTKRARSGEIVDQFVVRLAETDRNAGRFVGSIDLTRDEENTPLGEWVFGFDVMDELEEPNHNNTIFSRTIVAAPIHVEPVSRPASLIPTGARATFRFTLHYEDGAPVPADALDSLLDVRVFAHNGTTTVGEPLSGRLLPSFERGAWQVQYTVPDRLYEGRYAFHVSGSDRFGNRIAQGAVSAPFSTYAEPRARSVLTHPPDVVARGESAAVVFDGDPADVGPDATGLPRIQLERWDSVRGGWVVEVEDVRQDGFEGNDHVGIFEVVETTTIGVYRFVLDARDGNFRPLHASSGNFSVAATNVTRALVEAPPRLVVKGTPFTFLIERRDGDQLRSINILYNGRPTGLPAPIHQQLREGTNFTWAVPFEAPPGNYTFVVEGRDVYGNRIVVRTPAVQALAAQLEGRVLGNPPRVVARGETVTVLFGILYPDGGYYASGQGPQAFVMNETGVVASAGVQRHVTAYQITWTPPAEVGTGAYWFEITGRGSAGNLFPTLRTDTFELRPGSFTRDITDRPVQRATRGEVVTMGVAYSPLDAFVGFELEYLGSSRDPSELAEREAVTVTTIAHEVDPQAGKYVARFRTDYGTALGGYRIVMRGEDKLGNEIEARSDLFVLSPISIIVRWDAFPDTSTFGEGKTLRFTFQLEYADRTPMTDARGTPNAAILIDGRPITDRPDVRFEGDRWVATWTAPDVLIDGNYALAIGGTDVDGNVISTRTSSTYPFESSVTESFGKVVPGPAPLLAIALAALCALLFGRRARRS